MAAIEDAWLWGWDPTPGIVSVWAEVDGRAHVWRRIPETGALVRDDVRFRPWLVIAHLEDLAHLGPRLVPERDGATHGVTHRELAGPGALRHLVRAGDMRTLTAAIVHGASRRLGHPVGHLRDLPPGEVLVLPPEEQYLVASGRTYFRGLAFDQLRRLQLDLETTGLDPAHDRIFLVAVRDPDGATQMLEARDETPAAEADLLARLVAHVTACDPDVLENHNLHGFDLPFLERRARLLGVPLALGRAGPPAVELRARPARRGGPSPTHPLRRVRYTMPGRELIDTLDATLRHDFSARDLPGHGLKAVARHLGLAASDREHIAGAHIYDVYRRDPDRVRRYAADDVAEVAGLARMFGGAAFALAGMAPRRYERLAETGAATGVIDPLLVRAYLRSGAALPAHEAGDGTPHSGAALHLFAAGVAHRIVKADVASLYPSLMREYRIGPARDRLGAMLAIVDRLVDHRLAAKARGRAAPAGSAARFAHEAMSAAMKLVINSAYGYLGAAGLTRFSDVHAANEVTRRGRDVLGLLCRELAARGTTLIEADTDGVYFAVPASWTEADERRVVAEVAALLPARVQLELEGRYAAMLSHEPKNYALRPYPRASGSPDTPQAAPGSTTGALTQPEAADSRGDPPSATGSTAGSRRHPLASASPGGPPAGADSTAGSQTQGTVVLRGVAFRSSRAEPFGEAFLRRALDHLLVDDVAGVQRVYLDTVMALRRRQVPTRDVSARVRLTKSPAQYLATREARHELSYEAVLASGRTQWAIGERVRVYRATRGRARLIVEPDEADDEGDDGEHATSALSDARARSPGAPRGPRDPRDSPDPRDPRDYDVEHYLRVLRDTYAARFARALSPDDFAAVFADPDQPSLFARSLTDARPILTVLVEPAAESAGDRHAIHA